MLIPVAATAAGPGPVLATLIGVNVGPNLTYVGSLATLLWRRVLRAEDTDVELGEFLRLGALTVPAGLVDGHRAAVVSSQGLTDMRALVWIIEDTWQATIDDAKAAAERRGDHAAARRQHRTRNRRRGGAPWPARPPRTTAASPAAAAGRLRTGRPGAARRSPEQAGAPRHPRVPTRASRT